MKLDGNAIHYLLAKDFDDVVCSLPERGIRTDYPILYDAAADMSGHAVLVPDHERPQAGPTMQNVMCVCMGDEPARAAKEAGLAVAQVRDPVTFPQLYNSMLANYVRNERMDARLRAYVDTYAGFQPLLEACTDAMGFPCVLVDTAYRVVASPGGNSADARTLVGSDVLDTFDQDVFDRFAGSEDYRTMRKSRRVFAVPGSYGLFMKNVFSKSEMIGTLVMRHDGDTLSARFVRFLLGYLAPFVEEMYTNIGSFARSQTEAARIREELVGVLEGRTEDYARIDELLSADGHEPDSRYALLLVDRTFSQEGSEGLHYLAQRIDQTWTKSYSVVAGDRLYVLAYVGTKEDEHDHALRTDLPELLRDIMAKAGVSRIFSSMADLPAARTQANAALVQGTVDDPTRWYYHFDDYALTFLMSHGIGGRDPAHVCHPAVSVLARHDSEQGSDLLPTLKVFLECRYNASAASERLFVARSTLLNRLERIQDLVPLDLESLDERTYLAMSLNLMNHAQEG